MSQFQSLFVSVFTHKKQRTMLTYHFFQALQSSASCCTPLTSHPLKSAAPIVDFAAYSSGDRSFEEVQP
jgi:hypothetical protein